MKINIPNNKLEEVLYDFNFNSSKSLIGCEKNKTVIKSRNDFIITGNEYVNNDLYRVTYVNVYVSNNDRKKFRDYGNSILTQQDMNNFEFLLLLFINGKIIPNSMILFKYVNNILKIYIKEEYFNDIIDINSSEFIQFTKKSTNELHECEINDDNVDILCGSNALTFKDGKFLSVYQDYIKMENVNYNFKLNYINLHDIYMVITPVDNIIKFKNIKSRLVKDNILIFKNNLLISNDIISIKNNILILNTEDISDLKIILFHKSECYDRIFKNEQSEIELFRDVEKLFEENIAPNFLTDDNNDLEFDYSLNDFKKSDIKGIDEYRYTKFKDLLNKYPPSYTSLLNSIDLDNTYRCNKNSEEVLKLIKTDNSNIMEYDNITYFDKEMLFIPYRFNDNNEYVLFINGDFIPFNDKFMFDIPFTNYKYQYVDKSLIDISNGINIEILSYEKNNSYIKLIDTSSENFILKKNEFKYNNIGDVIFLLESGIGDKKIDITDKLEIKELSDGIYITIPEELLNTNIYISNRNILKIFSGYLLNEITSDDFTLYVDELDMLRPNINNIMLFKEGKYISRNYYDILLPEKDNDINHVTIKCKFSISQLNSIYVVYSNIDREAKMQTSIINEYGIVKFNNDIKTPLHDNFIDIFLNGRKLSKDQFIPVTNNMLIIKGVKSRYDLEILVENLESEFTDNYINSSNTWGPYLYYDKMTNNEIVDIFKLKEIPNSEFRYATNIILPMVLEQYVLFWKNYKDKIIDGNLELSNEELNKYSALINSKGNIILDLSANLAHNEDIIFNANLFDDPFDNHKALSFFTHQQLSSYTHQQLRGIKVDNNNE